MYPEVGYDLPITVALVKRELDSMNIPYTEKYGKGSVVAYINPDKTDFTIGIRADMDALKMTEESVGKYADITVLDKGYNVATTFVNGEEYKNILDY